MFKVKLGMLIALGAIVSGCASAPSERLVANESASEFRVEYDLSQTADGMQVTERLFIRKTGAAYDEQSYAVKRDPSVLKEILTPGSGRMRIEDVTLNLSSQTDVYNKVTVSRYRQLEFAPTYRTDEVFARINTLTIKRDSALKTLDLDQSEWSVGSGESVAMLCTSK